MPRTGPGAGESRINFDGFFEFGNSPIRGTQLGERETASAMLPCSA
jgi:hypothetical protein